MFGGMVGYAKMYFLRVFYTSKTYTYVISQAVVGRTVNEYSFEEDIVRQFVVQEIATHGDSDSFDERDATQKRRKSFSNTLLSCSALTIQYNDNIIIVVIGVRSIILYFIYG